MANPEHLNILKQGVEAWNAWRKANQNVRPELAEANLSEVGPVKADLSEVGLVKADLSGADLSGANLSKAHLLQAGLSGADLSGADLSGADLSGADLSGANLSKARLFQANLSWATLTGADLSEADLSLTGLVQADFSGANLSGANLSEASLFRANLSEASLFRANLSQARLVQATLSGANLSQANLTGANLTKADLTEANLTGTDLTKVTRLGAKLPGANLPIEVQINIPGDTDFDTEGRIRDAIGNFMEAFDFELKGKTEPRYGSFFQRLIFWAKDKINEDELEKKYKEMEEVLKVAKTYKPSAEILEKQAAAAGQLLARIKDIPNAVLRLDRVLIIKITRQGQPSLMIETLSHEIARQMDENPGSLRTPGHALQFLEEHKQLQKIPAYPRKEKDKKGNPQ